MKEQLAASGDAVVWAWSRGDVGGPLTAGRDVIDVFAHGALSAPIATTASGGTVGSVQAIGPIAVSITADQLIDYVRSGDEVSATLTATRVNTVIELAADRQMTHVRTFHAGPHSEASQKLLNELAAAWVCLLSKDKKATNDETLRSKIDAYSVAPTVTNTCRRPAGAVSNSMFGTPSIAGWRPLAIDFCFQSGSAASRSTEVAQLS